MTKSPEPTLKTKRKLANEVTDEPPKRDLPPTKLRKEIKQKMNQLGENIVPVKDGEYFARLPKEGSENLAVSGRDIYPTILPSLRQTSIAPTKQGLRGRSNLCPRCTSIALDTLLSRPHKTKAGQAAKNLSSVPNWEIDSCALCSLMSSTMELRYWTPERKVPLRTYSSNKMEDHAWKSINTNLLKAGHSSRYIVSQPEGIEGPVKIIKDRIDETNFETVKNWISLCQDKHIKICSVENPSFIPGLKLIDCITGDIIMLEDKPYLALSYVWGSSSEIPENPNKLPEAIPNTIEDAIMVVKKLGYRYLWVDRYCINQGNEEEKADQCGKMDIIYQNADLTIIAAIGDDPTYGLPGVSLRKRKPKHLTTCSKIGKHFLISTEAWPKEAVKGTKWKTRAWTYQEALLSRRRLLFTEEQMYFECYGMYCGESVHFPLQAMHRKDMQGFKRDFCSEEDLVGVFPKGVGNKSVEIVRRIEEYSELNLTNPSDILRAMLGIFNAFRRNNLGIEHCLGIPILPLMKKVLSRLMDGHRPWDSSLGYFGT